MTDPVYGLTAGAAKVLQEMANKHRQRLPDAGRRPRRVGPQARVGGGSVVGPCSTYTVSEELEDDTPTVYDVDYGSGCLGPNRWGITLVSIDGTNITTLAAEAESATVYSTPVFSWACEAFSIDLYARLTFSGRAQEDVLVEFFKDSDDSLFSEFWNSIAAFDLAIGGYLQFKFAVCNCGTFSPELCLAPPTVAA